MFKCVKKNNSSMIDINLGDLFDLFHIFFQSIDKKYMERHKVDNNNKIIQQVNILYNRHSNILIAYN